MLDIVASTGSTNSDLLERIRADNPPPEGYWLIADRQLAGRGRQGRAWLDAEGNFSGSTAIHLRAGDPPAPTLALLVGVAVHEALGAGSELRLKWPNDVLLNGAKLVGILLERHGDHVVAGIGVNLVAAPEIAGRRVGKMPVATTRNAFAEHLAGIFSTLLARWHEGGPLDWLLADWTNRALPRGTLLACEHATAGPVTGTFAGLSPDGALLLRLADGAVHVIHAGDVELVGEG